MNQHTENLDIGYKLSIDDSKQGTRQLQDVDDFESMVRMLSQRVHNARATTKLVTVIIIDLTATVDDSQQKPSGRASKVCCSILERHH
jgi:hypothetical protein